MAKHGSLRGNSSKRGSGVGSRALVLGIVTFVVALAATYPAQQVISELHLLLGLFTITFIILIGVIFDIIGVAAAAAEEAPFHAMAARRRPGSRQAIWIVRHAPAVASFSNDVIGDAAGTVTGAGAAAIALRLPDLWPDLDSALAGMFLVALVSGVTVGTKALGKTLAIGSAQKIVLSAGRVLYVLERLGIAAFSLGRGGRNAPGRGSSGNRPERKKGKG